MPYDPPMARDGRRSRGRLDPLWRRAPLLLASYPGAGLTVAAAVAVLAVAAASAPLLVSSAQAAAFARAQERPVGRAEGVVVTAEGDATGDVAAVDGMLRRELGALPGLADVEATLAGLRFQRRPDATGVRAPGTDGTTTATLLARDALLAHIGARTDTTDVWLPDTLATALDIGPGLNVIIGWEQPDQGSVVRRSPALRRDWGAMAVVPQRLGLIEELTLAENVALPLALAGRDAPTVTGELFERLGLAHLADRLPPEVSLGEQQRTAVARALVDEPALVVLDEPTGNQDEASAQRILTVLRGACEKGSACVLATHDPLVLGAVDRVVRLHDGRLVRDGP